MLVLTRQRDQAIMIGEEIEISVLDIRGDKTRIGITAPRSVSVYRKEIYDEIRAANEQAGQISPEDVASLIGSPAPMMKIAPTDVPEGDVFLKAAIEQAKKSLTQKGLPIGAVLVRGGKVIGKGHDRRVQRGDPTALAELDCLSGAARQATYCDTVLYTTFNPTLIAAGAIIQFGIPKVVIADTINHSGAACAKTSSRQLLSDCGVEVIDPQDREAIDLMAAFIRDNPEVWKAAGGQS